MHFQSSVPLKPSANQRRRRAKSLTLYRSCSHPTPALRDTALYKKIHQPAIVRSFCLVFKIKRKKKVKYPLSAQRAAELAQTPQLQRYWHQKDLDEQLPIDLGCFLLEETLNFTSFSGTSEGCHDHGKTQQGHLWLG